MSRRKNLTHSKALTYVRTNHCCALNNYFIGITTTTTTSYRLTAFVQISPNLAMQFFLVCCMPIFSSGNFGG